MAKNEIEMTLTMDEKTKATLDGLKQSRRQDMAATITAGLIANRPGTLPMSVNSVKCITEAAVRLADAIIELTSE